VTSAPRFLNPPGRRIVSVEVWLGALSPVLLSLAGGLLLGLGLWRGVDSVSVIGAIALVTGLILPRLKGAFEIGPGGIKGDLGNDLFTAVFRKGLESGLPAEGAAELAAGATGPTGAVGLPIPQTGFAGATGATGPEGAVSPATGLAGPLGPTGSVSPGGGGSLGPTGATGPADSDWWYRTYVDQVASQVVSASVALQQAAQEIIERVAAEKKWRVSRDMRVERDDGRFRIFDLYIQTRKGPIYVETGVFGSAEALAQRSAAIDEAVRDREKVGALIVVPDCTMHGRFAPEVEVVEVGQLEELLRKPSGLMRSLLRAERRDERRGASYLRRAEALTPWGAETRSSCRGALVFVVEAAEQVAVAHLKSPRRRLRSEA
jgi:hypothetical protein